MSFSASPERAPEHVAMEPPLQHVGKVPHSAADHPGYWGPRTASVDWCEPNYVWSPYVAEWWNTVSSLAIVASGLMGVWNCLKYGYKMRFLYPSIFMVLVGVGSLLFHGTLQYGANFLSHGRPEDTFVSLLAPHPLCISRAELVQ